MEDVLLECGELLPHGWVVTVVKIIGINPTTGWNLNVFPGNIPNDATVAVDSTYTLATTECGAVADTDKVKPAQSTNNPHWSLRYVVNNNVQACPNGRRRMRGLKMLKNDLAEAEASMVRLSAELEGLVGKEE
jgi:hypothetical protein